MLNRDDTEVQLLINFLTTETPKTWLEYASAQIPTLLLDHAHCERKAAASAINFISKYPQQRELVSVMSPLAREELLHFEKVLHLMTQRGIPFRPLQPSEYALKMHHLVTNRSGMDRLRDQLIVGAIIEARSCERFYAIIPYLNDPELEKFYKSLIKSEARHFENYLELARLYGGEIDDRVKMFLAVENKFILDIDTVFRFHSGIPIAN